MARIVVKFGGTSVADLTRIRTVADRVKREVDAGLLQDMMVFEFVQREVLRAAA
jgi:aspartokinase